MAQRTGGKIMLTEWFIHAGPKYATLDDYKVKHYVPAPYFRRRFEVRQELRSAKVQICGLGFYELHINGDNITKGYLAPYRGNPEHYLYYDEYDIGDIVRQGNNVIAILLGNGMQNPAGAFVWQFDKASWRGAPQVSFEIRLTYMDGHEEVITSDESTKTAPSPILFDDLHYGEYYDARLEIEGWDRIEYDDSQWACAKLVEAPCGELRIPEAEPLRLRSEIKPVAVWECDGGYIYDFGVNTSGLCRLQVKSAEAGQRILLQHFETLVDGKPFFDGIRYPYMKLDALFQEDVYYCSGRETEEYVPHFTYHGFRYVYVTGITEQQADASLLTLLEICTELETRGTFNCSDMIANKIQEATVRSDYSNFHYFPTDCPHREKNGWTADASLSAEQMLLNLSVEKSFREWMRNIYKAIDDDGKIPGVIPTAGYGYEWGNGPAWDNVIVHLPYYTYKYRGDLTILEECAEPLMRYLTYLHTRLDENNLIEYGLGDWCQAGRVGADFDTPLIVTDSILTVDITRKAEFIYEVLGMDEQKAYAKSFGDLVTESIRKHLIDKETLVVRGDTQSGQAMALYYGMFTEAEKEKAFAHLLKQIEREDGHIATGVLGGRVIFRLLAENGQADLAWHMITRPDYPSYGNWMARGATTLWETFFPEGGRILSMNHHFWGDVSAWFYYYPGGIRFNPTGKNIHHVDIVPSFIKKLDFATASHQTMEGKITVHWERKKKNILLEITVPEVIFGTIQLPEGYQFEDGTCSVAIQTGSYKVMEL